MAPATDRAALGLGIAATELWPLSERFAKKTTARSGGQMLRQGSVTGEPRTRRP